MNEELTDYQKYFYPGLRVSIRFPQPQVTAFQECGTIAFSSEDLLELQLSRDMLPPGVGTDTGTILVLRLGKERTGLCCNAIIVGQHEGAKITTRLIGDVFPDELRDFYRIDAYIPIHYEIPEVHALEWVKAQWKENRYSNEQQSSPDNETLRFARNVTDGQKNGHLIPVAANVSGSGIRIKIHEKLKIDDLLFLDLFLPLEIPQVLKVVGQVVHVNPIPAQEGELPLHTTALYFLCIDERDRDAIVKFVSSVQLEHLKNLGGPSANIAIVENVADTRRRRWRKFLFAIVTVAIVSSIVAALVTYRLTAGKGEIEQTYEREIKKYRERLNW